MKQCNIPATVLYVLTHAGDVHLIDGVGIGVSMAAAGTATDPVSYRYFFSACNGFETV